MPNTEVRRHGQWLLGAALLFLCCACSGPEVSERQASRQSYIVRFVFEGTLGFYSEKWNNQSPFFVLIPTASHGHEPAILIHERFVQDSIGNGQYRQPSGQRPGGMVEYGLLGEEVGFTATTVITPNLTKHRRTGNPENRPCQDGGCGTGSDYGKKYLDRKLALDWLAPVEWFGKGATLSSDCLKDACSGDSKALLAGRLMFEKGVVKTHRLEGEFSASQVDGELREFKLQFKNGQSTETEVALASSVAVEIEVSGDLNISLTPIYIYGGTQSIIPVKRSNEDVVEIFVVNLPSRDAAQNCGSPPCPVLHFEALHTLLSPFPGWPPLDKNDWGVPVWQSSGSAGDEACPPGCYNCR